VVEPYLQGRCRAENVQRRADHDRIGGLELIDQLIGERPGSGLYRIRRLASAQGGGGIKHQVRNRLPTEISPGDAEGTR
jgi:hypothetical protein